MVAEEIVITLSGGAPWGFRLQGGAEQQEPLQVAKVQEHAPHGGPSMRVGWMWFGLLTALALDANTATDFRLTLSAVG